MQSKINQIIDQIRIGNSSKAIENLKAVLANNPEHGEAHAILALCLYNQKRLHAARYEAEEALRFTTEYYLPYYVLGLVNSSSYDYQEAEANFLEAIRLDTDFTPAYCALASQYENLNQREKALELLNKALEIDSEDLDVLTTLAQHHFNNNEIRQAKSLSLSVLKIDSEYYDALILMARISLREGNTEEAKELVLSALNQNPTDQDALSLLCSLKFKESYIFGLWWRLNSFMASFGNRQSIRILMIAFTFFTLLSYLALDFISMKVSDAISYLWLAICVYSWVAPGCFNRALKKEMKRVELQSSY